MIGGAVAAAAVVVGTLVMMATAQGKIPTGKAGASGANSSTTPGATGVAALPSGDEATTSGRAPGSDLNNASNGPTDTAASPGATVASGGPSSAAGAPSPAASGPGNVSGAPVGPPTGGPTSVGASSPAPSAPSQTTAKPTTPSPPPPPPTTTPISRSCTGWPTKHSVAQDGWGTSVGDWNLKLGPYENCPNNPGSLPSGTKFWFWCYTVNANGNTFVYGRVDGTQNYGWESIVNFKNVTNPQLHC